MRDIKTDLTSSKSSKKLYNRRGKSFGYQVLGFGAGASGLGPLNGIFMFGSTYNSDMVNISNRVSPTGVVSADQSGVGTARMMGIATSYGTGLALYAFGKTAPAYVSLSNKVDITGIVATDTSGVGTDRSQLMGSTYGTGTGIMAYGGGTSNNLNMSNLINTSGVVASDGPNVGTGRYAGIGAPYGGDKALFYGGQIGGGPGAQNMKNLVNSSGVVASDTAGGSPPQRERAACEYGTGGTAIIVYGAPSLSGSQLINSSGVIASQVTRVGVERFYPSGVPYGGDKGVIAYGANISSGSGLNVTNLVNSSGVVGSDSTVAGTLRRGLGGAACGE